MAENILKNNFVADKIQVAVRVRPLSKTETDAGNDSLLQVQNNSQLLLKNLYQ